MLIRMEQVHMQMLKNIGQEILLNGRVKSQKLHILVETQKYIIFLLTNMVGNGEAHGLHTEITNIFKK